MSTGKQYLTRLALSLKMDTCGKYLIQKKQEQNLKKK